MGANVDGVVFGVPAVVPVIDQEARRRHGGTASLAGLIAFPPDPIYTLTKHAVVELVRSLGPQLQVNGITINAVCPGIVDTPLVGDEAKAGLQANGFRLIVPDEIAAAVLDCVTGDGTGPGRTRPRHLRVQRRPRPRRGEQRDIRSVGDGRL